jgi:hypothetical protein
MLPAETDELDDKLRVSVLRCCTLQLQCGFTSSHRTYVVLQPWHECSTKTSLRASNIENNNNDKSVFSSRPKHLHNVHCQAL